MENEVILNNKFDIAEVKNRVLTLHQLIKSVMKRDLHYGVIPGCKQPSLLQPGAELIAMTFRLIPKYEIERVEMGNGHREYITTCSLFSSGQIVGMGMGSASTMETKHRYRKAEKSCPTCNAVGTIIKSTDFQTKQPNGYLCYNKKGGCGAKFNLGDRSIEDQITGMIDNPDPADLYNTVLMMSQKRALVKAIRSATAASEVFTQDVEDMPEFQNKVVAAEVLDAQHTEILRGADEREKDLGSEYQPYRLQGTKSFKGKTLNEVKFEHLKMWLEKDEFRNVLTETDIKEIERFIRDEPPFE